MVSSSLSAFESLAPRPPTPPRDVSRTADVANLSPRNLEQVPEISVNRNETAEDENLPGPATPSVASSVDVSSNGSKKVGFSLQPTYHIEQTIRIPGLFGAQLPKRSPLSKELRPGKSILKVSNNLSPLTPDDLDRKLSYFSPEIPGSFAKMLQSVVQQLASMSRSSRLDSYMALNGTLQAYTDVPDAQAIVSNMGLIMQFLTRDMAWKDADGKLDVQIISQALKLTAIILGDAKLSEAVDSDFKNFVIDRSIVVMQHDDFPKPIMKMQIFLLAHQRFSSLVMTASRAERIITALRDIEERCSGNSIVSARLVVYSRLLDQAPSTLLARIPDWLRHVCHGMMSSIKDTRVRAIEVGIKAGLAFGGQPTASRALNDILETKTESETETEESQSYYDYVYGRLLKMVAEKELGEYVPQIWSAITLFFRNKRRPLESWPKFKSWLLLIQRCLNASDAATRQHAFLAWNKLVFDVMPDSSTSESLLAMLKVPIYTGLDKRGSDKHAKQHRQCALNSLYNLLHYSLRPGLSYEEYDRAWAFFVKPLLSESTRASVKGRLVACRVLYGLLSLSTGVWNANAAFANVPLVPEDLPKLEPRWVRSRLSNFLDILQPSIASTMTSADEVTAPLDATWAAMMHVVGEAGNQEIRTSSDLKEALALLVNFLRGLWRQVKAMPDGTDASAWLNRYASLVESMVVRLGPAPFTEEILATNDDDSVEVASTPSGRPSRHAGPPQSPLVILFGLLYTLPANTPRSPRSCASIASVLSVLISSKTNSAGKLDLLSRSVYIWSTTRPRESPATSKSLPCAAVLEVARQALTSRVSSANDQQSQSLGHCLRNALNILTSTLQYLSNELDLGMLGQITSFYSTICTVAKEAAGEGGVTSGVTEPFSRTLIGMKATLGLNVWLHIATYVLQETVWPSTRASVEQAKKTLWGFSVASHKTNTFDPFDASYELLIDSMRRAYSSLNEQDAPSWDDVAQTVSAALWFLKSCPVYLLPAALRQTQQGFVVWVEDKSQKAKANNLVTSMTCQTWTELLELLKSLHTKDAAILKTLEPLIVAGFSSPHRSIANSTIEFWNNTFGQEQALTYPKQLEKVLRNRSADAELNLPGFPESNDAEGTISLPEFYEEEPEETVRQEPPKPFSNHSPYPQRLSALRSPLAKARATPSKSSSPLQYRSSQRRSNITSGSANRTPKACLRHDDSQIQFAPIESSSPLAGANESQNLTEHQKEVTARQQQNAQLFPDFSSSPFAQSTAVQEASRKRLDFNVDQDKRTDDAGSGTPLGLQEQDALPSDDYPSSPTPSSNKEATPMPLKFDDEVAAEDLEEPPSSPPQDDADANEIPIQLQGPQGQDVDETIAVTDFANALTNELQEEVAQAAPSSKEPEQLIEVETDVDLASDNALPTAQLQEEEAAAGERQISEEADVQRPQVEDTTRLIEPPTANEGTATPSDPADASDGRSQEMCEPAYEDNEVTRIEDSFTGGDHISDDVDDDDDDDVIPDNDSQQSQRPTRKRKRRSALFTQRKRKQQSPLKRILSLFRQSQEESEEDMEDEIVVASSQPSQDARGASPSPTNPEVNVKLEAEHMDEEKSPRETPLLADVPQKRGRGRPRKSGSSASAPVEIAPDHAKSLKRRISTRSLTSSLPEDERAGSIDEYAAPSRKRTRSSGLELQASASSQQQSHDPASTSHHLIPATAVVVPMPKSGTSDGMPAGHPSTGEQDEVEAPRPETPVKHVAAGQAGTLNDRPIATPRSIIGRLRAALVDLKGIFLPAETEREMDDVLFELRKEAHEAGRRGREMQD